MLPQAIDQTENLRIILSDPMAAPAVNEWLASEDITDSRLLFSTSLAEEIADTFPLNAKFGSTIKNRNLSVQKSNIQLDSLLFLQEESLTYEIEIGRWLGLANQDEPSLVSEASEEFENLWQGGASLSIDVPPWEDLIENLRETAGERVEKEYKQLISGAAAEEIYSLDEISLVIVAGALAEALNYDIGRWSEEMNIASKATISRRKSELESQGVIMTEKVPVEVGRPRQRLKLSPRVQGSIMGGEEISGDILIQEPKSDDSVQDVDVTKETGRPVNDQSGEMEEVDRDDSDVIERIRREIIGVISAEDG